MCRDSDCGSLLEYYDKSVSTTMKLCTSTPPSGYECSQQQCFEKKPIDEILDLDHVQCQLS